MAGVTGSVVGREAKIIRSAGTTWGTESTATYYEWKLLGDGLSFSQDLDPIEESNSTWLKDADLGNTSASFTPRHALYFDDIHAIAQVLGDGNYATPAEENTGKGDYKHTVYPDEDNNGDFETVAVKKGAYIHSLHSVKYPGFHVEGQASPQRIEISFDTLVSNLDNASAVLTAADFTAATAQPSGNGGRAFFRNFTFRINDQSGATLGVGDAISNVVTGFKFSFVRSLTEDRTNSSGLQIEEPVEDSYPETTLRLDLRNLDGDIDTFITNYLAGTKKKLDFEITGSAASTATGTVATASFKISAPNAKLESVDAGSYEGPGRISSSVIFRLHGTDTTGDANGMAFLEPFKLEVINAQSGAAVS